MGWRYLSYLLAGTQPLWGILLEDSHQTQESHLPIPAPQTSPFRGGRCVARVLAGGGRDLTEGTGPLWHLSLE